MSDYTRGPWRWACDWAPDSINHYYDGGMGGLEAENAQVLWYGMDGEENIYCPNKQDSLLIQSAPDMFEALEELVSLVEGAIEGDYEFDSFSLQPAQLALKKARGD